MRRAAHIGGVLLLSLAGLGCSQERVVLGGLGAGGSASQGAPVAVVRTAAGAPAGPRPALPQTPSPTITAIRPALPSAPVPPLAAYDALISIADATPPIAGGTLAVAADGSTVVAADPDRNAVYIVDLPSRGERRAQLPAASEPGRVVLDGAGYAHVVLRGAGKLARIELSTGKLELSKPLCDHPRGLAFDAAANALVLACADGALLTLDPRNSGVRSRVTLARDLRDVVLGLNGERFVSRFRSAQLLHLDAQGRLLGQDRPQALPRPVMTSEPKPNVQLIDTSAALAYRSVAGPDGAVWMVHQRAQDAALDEGMTYTGTLGCGPITQPSLTSFDGQGHPQLSLQVHRPASVAVDLAISQDGQWLALATPGAFVRGQSTVRLQRTDTWTLQGRIMSDKRVTQELPDFQQTFCSPPDLIEPERNVQATALAFDAQGKLYVQSRVPARVDVLTLTGRDANASAVLERSIVLADDPMRDLGHELFHGDAGSEGLSCASCHGEGDDDGHVWRFGGVGPRRTPSLRGGLLDTLPMQWSGDASFEAVVRGTMNHMNGTELPDAYVLALGTWLQKLPALRVEAGDQPAAMRGKAMFEMSCSACHAGDALTNDESMDVGTNGVFQVPSLRGVGIRSPLMHDGCAQSLSDLGACGGPAHAGMSPELIAYVASL